MSGKMQREVSGVMFSYYDDKKDQSEYHNKCVPAAASRPAAVPASHKSSQQHAVDVVVADKIWRQNLSKEKMGAQNWKDNWAFLAEFNDKGELKEVEELPEKVNMFSENVPNTNAGNYGHRVGTEAGMKLQQLEFQLCSGNRRRKMGGNMVCY